MKKQRPKIVCAHLLNDFSGSPKVLSQLITSFVEQQYEVDVFTSNSSKQGFLSNIKGVAYHSFFYQWSSIKLVTLLFFFLSQLILFFKLFRYLNQHVVIYVNTVLPIGAALAGKLMGKKVIYHVHETSISPLIFKKLLFTVAGKTVSEAIYVSQFLLEQEKIPKIRAHMVYNALSHNFIKKGEASSPKIEGHFTVLMLCSLKAYKGVNEFVALAQALPQLRFELVMNATTAEINDFFKRTLLPTNLTYFPSQQNVHPFYKRASLVVNLSHPLKWVETFGMTALEAMCYGLPVIVPPVGGIAELVENDSNGFKIDVRNVKELEKALTMLSSDTEVYQRLSSGARTKSKEFRLETMAGAVLNIINT